MKRRRKADTFWKARWPGAAAQLDVRHQEESKGETSKAYADWYCPNPECDADLIDGDSVIAPGQCHECGTPLEIVPGDDDKGAA
jgi:hypothetical protein